ncbi:peptidoglycan-recognition protein LB-like [Teleopsis dalmanni]|uniref:peptidoglycan-recognition protein LB-like n=1 Tax=Teleopsis dalmanni TaxID=139649 RepID=UPI000D32AE01|nr:peptidoglycan-recognition protein LB-like [Teleopsis dalmanni]XP_037953977.1 peptidoglycan-recognition protein LB-like [Teleopsis dalmanni]
MTRSDTQSDYLQGIPMIRKLTTNELLTVKTATTARTAPNAILSQLLISLSVLLLAYGSITTTSVNAMLFADAAPVDSETAISTGSGVARAWRLIKRSEWEAREPSDTVNFTGPAPYVIIHHSYNPGVCLTEDACKASMRSVQNFHMDEHGWADIGYSFAIGADGNVYEARGYNVVGAHAPNYNSQSIGLLLIGNFVEKLPPAPMLQVAQDFIKYSIETGQLRKDYILYGHRQVRDTECPGAALYAEIQKWKHWREVA